MEPDQDRHNNVIIHGIKAEKTSEMMCQVIGSVVFASDITAITG